MSLSLLNRYAFFACCVLFAIITLPLLPRMGQLWPVTAIAVVLSLLGLIDLLQTRHAVRRNYPILGRLRYLVESVRPEIRQYLIEGDNERTPFSRAQRSLVYARAKNEPADRPFGTQKDVYQPLHAAHGALRSRELSPQHRRSAVQAAVLGIHLQYLRDELWFLERQCRTGVEQGRPPRWVCS